MTEPTPTKRTPAKATPPAATEKVEGREHTTGDDPARSPEPGFHDSQTGRPVDSSGRFLDLTVAGSEGPVPRHRIVADDWPERAKEEHAESVVD